VLVMQSELNNFFKGKKVFITGHTGFKGSWMRACLHVLGATIKGYALVPDYKNGLHDLFESYEIGESVISDMRDKNRLKEEIISFQP
jgi:CDP-glucose 4,6-dehydratase